MSKTLKDKICNDCIMLQHCSQNPYERCALQRLEDLEKILYVIVQAEDQTHPFDVEWRSAAIQKAKLYLDIE